MTSLDFAYSGNFSGLSSTQIDDAIGMVETMYSGALTLWEPFPEPDRTNKRLLLENLLVGWYLANLYPSNTRGIVANGGLPLSAKSIGGTSVSFETMTVQNGMEQLKTNTFGLQALMLMQSAPERYMMYV